MGGERFFVILHGHGIIHLHRSPHLQQLAYNRDCRRLPDVIRIRFEGEPQQPDGAAADNLDRLLQLLDLSLIHI